VKQRPSREILAYFVGVTPGVFSRMSLAPAEPSDAAEQIRSML
jgi:hypothetical protein